MKGEGGGGGGKEESGGGGGNQEGSEGTKMSNEDFRRLLMKK